MRYAFLVLVLAVGGASAEPATRYGPADGLIRLNDRWFDARSPVEESWEDHEFFPIQRIDWIYDALDTEPLLDTMVIHIQAQPQASANIFHRIYHETGGYFPTRDVPDYVLPPQGFELLTKERPVNHVVRPITYRLGFDYLGVCFYSVERGGLLNCIAYADYPDPRLYLKARVYGPPPRMDAFAPMLPKVAARLREIAFCLDVTDEVLAGTWRPSPPPDDPVGALRDCEDEVIG